MGFWDNLRSLLPGSARVEPQAQSLAVTSRGSVVSVEEVQKALSVSRQMDMEKGNVSTLAQGRPTWFLDSPGGQGSVHAVGLSFEALRQFAVKNPTIASIINARAREVGSAQWGIVPDIDREKEELSRLRRLFVGVQRFPDLKRSMLEPYKPQSITPKMYREIKNACTSDGLTNSDIAYRLDLALLQIDMEAQANISRITPLFKFPNEDGQTWKLMRESMITDMLSLGWGFFEPRRTKYPQVSPEDPRPRCTNDLVEIGLVDAATIRPCINRHGDLKGSYSGENANERAYEQWINGQQTNREGFRRCDLICLEDSITSDIHWRGYPISRLEHLAITMVLMAKGDQAYLEELNRDYFGGFLLIQDPAWSQEDLSSFRRKHEQDWQQTKILPMMRLQEGADVKFVSAAPHQGGRDKYAHETKMDMVKRCCAIFDFPVTKLGIFENANYSTSETDSRHGDRGLMDLMQNFDQQMTQWIQREWGFSNVQYVSSIERFDEDKLSVAKERQDLGIDDINDTRMEFGRHPVELGDKPAAYYKAYWEEKGRMDAQQGMEEEGQEIEDEETEETGAEAQRPDQESEELDTDQDDDADTLKALMVEEVKKAFPQYDVDVEIQQ